MCAARKKKKDRKGEMGFVGNVLEKWICTSGCSSVNSVKGRDEPAYVGLCVLRVCCCY